MRAGSHEDRARLVGAMFARIVPRYDLMNTLMTLGMDRRWRELTVEAARVPPGGLALDVAAGTGELTFTLLRHGARVAVGADFCQDMLIAARDKARRRGARGALFVTGDALALPFPDDAFDAATVGFGLRNVSDLPGALAELRRVVRPGGRVVCLELTHPPSRLVAVAFHPYFHGLVPLVGGLISGDPLAYRYLPDSVLRFPSAPRLADLMREAGLRAVQYRLLGLGTVAIHVGVKAA